MSTDNANKQVAMSAKRLTTRGGSTTTAHVVSTKNSNGNPTLVSDAAALNGMSRLTPARDLTLGGRGGALPNKKVFAPNLNAVRNKNTNVKTSKDFTAPRGGRGRGARGGASTGATRGRGGSNSSLVQTTGVFSEGAGEVHLRKSTGSGVSYGRDEVSVSRKRNERKQDDKSSQSRGPADIDDRESDYVASDNEDDKTELVFKPVQLCEGLWRNTKSMVPTALDILKNENEVSDAPNILSAKVEEAPPQYGRYPSSVSSFLGSVEPQIFLMQLPNSLPCVTDNDFPDADESEKPTSKDDEPDEPTSPTETHAPKHSVLKQLAEGQIGKILRYRSGRVKLVLGETHFDLEMGLESGFLQELMSITTNREERSGNMINLGAIQSKLKATPDWKHLFEQQEIASRKQPSSSRTTTTTAPVSSGNST